MIIDEDSAKNSIILQAMKSYHLYGIIGQIGLSRIVKSALGIFGFDLNLMDIIS